MAAPPAAYRDDRADESLPALILARATQERVDRLFESDARERIENGLKTVFDRVNTRIDALDKAAEVFADNLNRVPTLLDREISRLKELFGARSITLENLITAVEKHLHELIDQNDLRYQQRFDASGKALDAATVSVAEGVRAALAAAKEAVASQNQANADSIAKSEASVLKQIDAASAKVEAMERTLNDKIGAINSRLDRGDGSTGAKSAGQATMLAVGALVVAVIAIGATFFHAQSAPVLTAPAVVPGALGGR